MNTKTITVNGVDVELYERTARQAQELTTLLDKMQKTSPDSVVLFYGSTSMVLQSLSKNIKATKLPASIHKFFNTKTHKWNQMFTAEYLVQHITLKELYTFCAIIMELEGNDNSFYRLLSKDLTPEEAQKLIDLQKKSQVVNPA